MDTQQTDPSRPRPPHRAARRRRALVVGAVALALTVGASTGAALDAIASPTTTAAAVPDRHGVGGGQGGDGQSQQTGTPATAQEQTGVVDVDTVLDYGTGEAAGTGIVLTAGGEILTNNHVVEGSTAIHVTDVTSGRTYTATVVGTDATDDVAVLALQGASGLTPATLASADAQGAVRAGTAVTAVGNAGGTGGTPSAAPGTVLALGQTITASDETSASDSENLAGMIEVDAAVQSGDSGGPLYADGAVIGIDTAASASSGPGYRTAADEQAAAPTTGYAIPIGKALQIAQQITSGVDDGTVHQGYPAFLGVQVASQAVEQTSEGAGAADGAPLTGVVSGSPAASAGLAAGDTVTAVDGQSTASADQLSSALAGHHVGDRVQVSWTDQAGTSHTATVTLAAGPAA
ncbi:S1C family serine protease [Actinomycetospora sp. TBRC 11914]|uniref:S1C family serine protease n=1 Tax=Actinomycetospora sp. TBRC 11914 TaxID=2729387 RepID=UPI00145DC663|nr:trypsin-like peptidase domain-containing protein [Actinomycetospora sp. TBRC 11914]NMO91330.1 PDZ domain-containing protein [Actinomycetospora sp. TBRC 11914]